MWNVSVLILGSLAAAVLGSLLLIAAYAQEDPCFPTYVAVPAGESRAALAKSRQPGLWTFRIESVKGNISRIDIQIYENTLPASGKLRNVYVVCASCPDHYGRPQADCGEDVSGPISTAGSLSIKRVNRNREHAFDSAVL